MYIQLKSKIHVVYTWVAVAKYVKDKTLINYMEKEEMTPLYKKLIDDLKKLIEDGKFKQGDLLPSENELCKSYKTTRPTVRQALAGLTNMGYITRHHGKGSIVSEPRRGLGILSVSGVTAGVGGSESENDNIGKTGKKELAPRIDERPQLRGTNSGLYLFYTCQNNK